MFEVKQRLTVNDWNFCFLQAALLVLIENSMLLNFFGKQPATFFKLFNSISSLQDTSHSLCLSDLSLISTDSELRENSNLVSHCL